MTQEHEAKDALPRSQPAAVDTAPVPDLQAGGAITPSEWTPQVTDSIPIETPFWHQPGLFGHNTPRKAWSVFSENDNDVRYELRAGETYSGSWPDQPPTERCEMGQHHRYSVRGNTFTVDYEWMVEEGPEISSDWLTCGQLHSALSASPPTEIMFHSNDKMGVSANTGSSKAIRWQTAWQDTQPIMRGHWYKMRLQQEQRQDGQGKVVLYRDGVKVCDFRGDVGYSDQTQTYWKQGVYRKRPDRNETVAMWFRNLKITEGLPVPSDPNHGGGGGGVDPTPEPEDKVVNVVIDVPAGVVVNVEINEE
jgi:hypothetical protein